MPAVIDFQHHFVPLELLTRRGFTPGERRNLIEGDPKLTVHDKLHDMDDQLRDMDLAGIDLAGMIRGLELPEGAAPAILGETAARLLHLVALR